MYSAINDIVRYYQWICSSVMQLSHFGLRIRAPLACLEIASIALGTANAKYFWEILSDIWAVISRDFMCSWWRLAAYRTSIRGSPPATCGGLMCLLKLLCLKTWRLHSTLFCIVLRPPPCVKRSSSFSYSISTVSNDWIATIAFWYRAYAILNCAK